VRTLVAAVLLIALAAVAGWTIGSQRTSTTVRSAMVHSLDSISTVAIDGWTYGIPLDVAWTDAAGSFHSNGRPDCLPKSTELIGPITFATVDASAGGTSWRQVVWVSCRPGA
jgi:hypothetical protein